MVSSGGPGTQGKLPALASFPSPEVLGVYGLPYTVHLPLEIVLQMEISLLCVFKNLSLSSFYLFSNDNLVSSHTYAYVYVYI